MPEQVIAPYLAASAARSPTSTTSSSRHADVDHCGGNRALRAAAPRRAPAVRRGRPRVDRVQRRMLAENYLWYEPYGCGPSPEDVAFLTRELGGDAPVDVGLTGARRCAWAPTGASRCWRCPATRRDTSASGTRAAARRSSSTPRSPTASTTAPATASSRRATTRRGPTRRPSAGLRALDPALLLTAHYEVMERDAARAFLDRSLAFVHAVGAATDENVQAGTTALWPLTQAVDAAGRPRSPPSRTSSPASVRAHLARV
jgi:hypothetical protein